MATRASSSARQPAPERRRRPPRRRKRSPPRSPERHLWRWRRWLFAHRSCSVSPPWPGRLTTLSRIPLPTRHPLSQTTFVYDDSGHAVLASFSEQNRVDVALARFRPVVIRRRGLYRGPALLHRGSPQPGEHRAGVHLRRRGLGQPPGRLHHHPAVRQADLSDLAAQPHPKDQRGGTGHPGLARSESKQEILQNYLNTIYWGRGAYGVEAAPQAYFGKNVSQLGLPEASLLAGLIREPETADPARESRAGPRQPDRHPEGDGARPARSPPPKPAAVEALPFSTYVDLAGCLDRR